MNCLSNDTNPRNTHAERKKRSTQHVGIAALLLMLGAHAAARAEVGDLLVTINHPHGQIARSDFGATLAATGPFIVVGAPQDEADPDRPGSLAGDGAVWVFDALGNRVSLIRAPRDITEDFGRSLAVLDGGLVLVGAPESDAGNRGASGEAYIIDPQSGAVPTIVPNPEPNFLADFGRAVAQVGGPGSASLAVSAPRGNCSGGPGDIGAVHSFVDGASSRICSPPPAGNADRFGSSIVGLGNSKIAIRVSVPRRVLIYDNLNGAGTPLELRNPDPANDASFGTALADFEGNLLTSGRIGNEGKVFLIDSNTGNIIQTYESPLPGARFFGGPIVVDGRRILIGDPVARNDDGEFAGAVYVFDAESAQLLLTIPSPTPDTEVSFGKAVAVSGTDYVISESGPPGNTSTGVIYIFEGFTDDCNNNGVPDDDDIANGTSTDCDDNGIPDECQADADGDGVPDVCDVCPDGDDNVDSDGDAVPDDCDICLGADDNLDADGDEIPDGCDICPGFDDALDSDLDGVPDGCDICLGADDNVDGDGDGVPDGCDICLAGDDNLDADLDGNPDACDLCPGADDNEDFDNDGVPDGCDICLGFDDNVDSDNDGVPDGCDICPGGNDANDADGDGVPDVCDVCPGSDDGADADADGAPDGCDRCPGFDDAIDSDNDGTPDGCDRCPGNDDNVDADQDGIPNGCDRCPGFDDALDADADDVPDGCDQCPNTQPGIPVDEVGCPLIVKNGDLNCDGAIGFEDIDPFVLALVDPARYAELFPGCPIEAADCNSDGRVSVGDIGCFVDLVIGE